jgi:glycosyltransferase involved in cell wall biosynthesis
MRIALFTDTYLPTINGVARTLGQLVSHAHARGHEVALVTPALSPGAADGTVVHHQLAAVPLPMYPEIPLARPLDRKGRDRLDRFQPELVHAATEFTIGWSGRLWAKKKGIPLVSSFHTDWPAYMRGYGFGGLETTAWRILQGFHGGARVTFCPSTSTLAQLRSWGFSHELRIWGRGVDTDLFSPKHRREDLRKEMTPVGGKVVLYVGRLAPEKRLDVLIEAFPLVRKALGQKVVLALVGDGPYMDKLKREKPDGVLLLGYRTGLPLAEAYASGDVFAFPSDTETFGNVVAEALASGLPVVAPKKGGVVDSVTPGRTGVLVPPRDPKAMADALISLLNDPAKLDALSRGARAHALARSWASVLDALFDDYREILANAA